MAREDADGYVRIKLDIDTTEDKKIERSLKDIQDDADSAKRKLDALKQTGVDESTRSCLLYTSPSARDAHESRMPSSA